MNRERDGERETKDRYKESIELEGHRKTWRELSNRFANTKNAKSI